MNDIESLNTRKCEQIISATPPNAHLRRHSRVLLWASNLWYFGEGMFGPFLAVFARRIGGDILEISVASAVYLGASGLLIVFIGRWSDRKHKAQLLVAGYALNALFTFAYLLVSTSTHLLLVQAGLGIAFGLATPTWDALYQQCNSVEQSGSAWGIAVGSSRIVTGAAILIGGFILEHFSFTVLFVVMGTIQIVAAVIQSQILQESKHER